MTGEERHRRPRLVFLGIIALLFCALLAFYHFSNVHADRSIAGTEKFTLTTSDGSERTYFVHVPPSYPLELTSFPLIVFFHGGGVDPYRFIEGTGLNELADKRNVIVAYPMGTSNSGAVLPMCWNTGTKHCASKAFDLEFTGRMLEALDEDFVINDDERYAIGFSVGGLFVHTDLRCAYGGSFAGFASVEGGVWNEDCPLTPPPAPLLFTAVDTDHPEENFWEMAWEYQCELTGRIDEHAHQYEYDDIMIRKILLEECEGRAALLLYEHSTTPHEWPSFPPSEGMHAVSSGEIILDFLSSR